MVEAQMSVLQDPCNDRPVKTLDPPFNRPLEQKLLYPYSGKLFNEDT
jgi:hypothetical protein